MGLAPFPWLERPAKVLSRMLTKLPGGVIIYGPRGTGVFELARSFAAAVVCEHPKEGAACGECEACKLTKAGTHPDLKMVLSEAEEALHPEPWAGAPKTSSTKTLSRQIRIDQIRDIGEYLSVSSHRGRGRAVVIYPADTMSADQSSALLKTLEEPPEGAVLVLAADDVSRLLPTIRSRCQLVGITPPSKEQSLEYLRALKVRAPEAELARLGGYPLLIHEEDPALVLDKKDEALLLDLLRKGAALSSADILSALKSDLAPGPVISLMQRFLWDLKALSLGVPPRYFPADKELMASLAANLDAGRLHSFYEVLLDAKKVKDHPLNKQLAVQMLFMEYAGALAASQKSG